MEMSFHKHILQDRVKIHYNTKSHSDRLLEDFSPNQSNKLVQYFPKDEIFGGYEEGIDQLFGSLIRKLNTFDKGIIAKVISTIEKVAFYTGRRIVIKKEVI